MSDPVDIARLRRAVRARVPMDGARLLAQQSPPRVAAVLDNLPPELARRIRQYLPPELMPPVDETLPHASWSRLQDVMEPVNGVLPESASVADAVAYLRAHPDPGAVTYLYAVDEDGRLTGLVVPRDLLLVSGATPVRTIMLPEPFALYLDMAPEDAIESALQRHYPVYPVIDAARQVHGLVRGWKLFERRAIEISAQSGQMVGVSKEERVGSRFWEAFRIRHP